MKILPIVVIVIGAMSLSSCQKLGFDDQGDRYPDTALIAPLVIPQDMVTQAFIPLFDLPPRADMGAEITKYQAPLPPITGLSPRSTTLLGQRQTGTAGGYAQQVEPSASAGFLSRIPVIGGLLARDQSGDQRVDQPERAESGSLLDKLPFFRSPPDDLTDQPETASDLAAPYEPVAPAAATAVSAPQITFKSTEPADTSNERINKTVVKDELGRPILFVQEGLSKSHARVAQALQKSGLSTESSDDLSVIRVRSKQSNPFLIYFSGRDQVTSVVVLGEDMTPAPQSTAMALIDLITTHW